MDVVLRQHNYLKKIRVFLVFFSLFTLFSCETVETVDSYSMQYDENRQASSIRFKANGEKSLYSVRLSGSKQNILGSWKRKGKDLVFAPVISFTSGQSYEVLKEADVYFTFDIPANSRLRQPKLLGIYPSLDTLPENLLKMYFTFDQPMQQSQATLDFIRVYDHTEKQEVKIFLPLENELWNADKTRLTLWLDPGRIKKDLIPNQERGIPIKKGHQYELTFSKDLQNYLGVALGKEYKKTFVVGERDTQSPNIKSWKFTLPELNTQSGLGVEFGEALDQFLVYETIRIVKDGKEFEGSFIVSKKLNSLVFIPSSPWKKGNYELEVESRLEDLAGNNLNRLFDVDLEKKVKESASEVKARSFVVQ